MTVKVIGRSYRHSKRNIANSDLIIKSTNYNRTNYLPSVPGPVATDSNFKDTVLLIHADGRSGANNTVFLDSSASNNTITIGGGKPTQGTFSPFNFPENSYSTFYNGTTDYLQFPRAAGAITTGPFTVEAWVNVTAHKSVNQLISNQYWSIGQNGGWGFYVGASGNVAFGACSGTFNVFPDVMVASAISTNTWNHLALVRDSSDFVNIYINGVASATPTLYSASLDRNTGGTQTNWLLNIGINNADGTNYNYFSGYVSNARIVNGTAVYTGNFTPPTSPLTAIPGTLWLTSQNKFVFKDNSLNNYTITVGGTPTRRSASPFATTNYAANNVGGSIFFNGTSDYITTNADAAFGTGDFTIEFWAYFNSVSGTQDLFDTRPAGTASTANYVAIELVSGALNYYTAAGNPSIAGGTLNIGLWYHIALCRSGTSTRMFINGTQTGSTLSDSQSYVNGANRPALGIDANLLNTSYLNGYLSNVKVIKGKALYTTTFTPPTAPATPTDAPVLLLNATNAGIIDQTSKNVLVTYGTSSVSSTQSKFGGTSMYFDGSSYIATANPGTLYQFGTSNWTIEAWVYPTSTATTQTIYQIYGTTNDNINLQFNGTSRAFFCDVRATNQTVLTATSTVLATLNAWNHVVVTRDSSTSVKLYVNGSLGATLTILSTTTFVDTQFAANPTIGAKTNTVTNYFTGYIDDLRVTKGVARYTSDFTPPSTAFPDQ